MPLASAVIARRGALIGVTALCLVAAACAAEEIPVVRREAATEMVGAYRSDAARSGVAIGVVGGVPRVSYRIDGAEPVIASPVLVGGTAIVPDGSGDLVAFDVSSGTVRWRSEIGDAEASVAASSDSVFSVSTNGTARRHELASGAVIWATDLDGFARSSPLLTDDELWLSVGGELVILDPTTGARLESIDLGAETDSSPASAGDVVVIGTRSNALVFINRATSVTSRIDLPEIDAGLTTYADGVAATPAIADGSVFVGSTGGVLVSTSLSGDIEWQLDVGSPIYGAAALGDGVGFIPTASGELIAFDLSNGERLWTAELGDAAYASPVLVGGSVLATAENGRLVALDAVSGLERWSIEVGEVGNYMASTPVIAGSMIVLGSNDGSIVAVTTDR